MAAEYFTSQAVPAHRLLDPPQGGFDDPEDEHQEPEAESDDSFLELDDLLAESVELADARKRARGGHRPKAEQELEDLLRMATPQRTWLAEQAIAHFVEANCSCGASHKRFDGWFILYSHLRDPQQIRLVRSESHDDLPAWQYVSQTATLYCEECLENDALVAATIEDFPILSSLGEPCPCCDQLELDLGD